MESGALDQLKLWEEVVPEYTESNCAVFAMSWRCSTFKLPRVFGAGPDLFKVWAEHAFLRHAEGLPA